MVKSPNLSDVIDRAKCSTEMTERVEGGGGRQSKLLCMGSQGREDEKDREEEEEQGWRQ